jgi:GntR family transcriptional regulator/MocR family aminotransferase
LSDATIPSAAWPPLDKVSGDLEGQIYRLVRERVLQGQLSPGQRLPSTRRLAAALSVARSTVVNAYERLKNEGYLQASAGSACRVSAMAKTPFQQQSQTRVAERPVPAEPAAAGKWFAPAVPDLSRFPHATWARCLGARARSLRIHDLGYGEACGLGALRRAILDHIGATRGVVARPEQLLIVPSTRAAIDLLSLLVLSKVDMASKVAWVEDPGYPTAKALLSAAGATLLPAPCDSEGIRLDGVGRPPQLIYVTPSHQYPTGVTMSLSRRMALLAAAKTHGALVLEDDYDSEFQYGSRPIASLQGIDRHGVVAYLGTFSKTLAPGLRVAYAVVPPSLLSAAAELQLLRSAVVPIHVQAALADFIGEGRFRAHLRQMNTLYASRMAATVDALQRHLGEIMRIGVGAGGLQLVTWFHDERVDDRVIALALNAQGFAMRPMSSFYLGRARPGLLFGIAQVTIEDVESLAGRIRNIIVPLA